MFALLNVFLLANDWNKVSVIYWLCYLFLFLVFYFFLYLLKFYFNFVYYTRLIQSFTIRLDILFAERMKRVNKSPCWPLSSQHSSLGMSDPFIPSRVSLFRLVWWLYPRCMKSNPCRHQIYISSKISGNLVKKKKRYLLTEKWLSLLYLVCVGVCVCVYV